MWSVRASFLHTYCFVFFFVNRFKWIRVTSSWTYSFDTGVSRWHLAAAASLLSSADHPGARARSPAMTYINMAYISTYLHTCVVHMLRTLQPLFLIIFIICSIACGNTDTYTWWSQNINLLALRYTGLPTLFHLAVSNTIHCSRCLVLPYYPFWNNDFSFFGFDIFK